MVKDVRSMLMSLTGLVMLLLIVGVPIGVGGYRVVRDAIVMLDPGQRPLFLEREAAAQPLRIAQMRSAVIMRIVLNVAATAALVTVLLFASVAAIRWALLNASLVRARAGLFPTRDARPWPVDVVNYNYPATETRIAQAILAVQRTAALASGANVSVTMADVPPTSAAAPEIAPAAELPTRIPLRGLLTGAPSLHSLVLGVALNGAGQLETVTGDMEELVHIAIGGSAGGGKSSFERALAWQIINAVERPQMAVIDLEGLTLARLAPRLAYPMADNEADAVELLDKITEEIERRKQLYQALPVDSLRDYNSRVDDPLPHVILFVDEATALLDNKRVEASLRQVALRARKYGIWAVLAGQDWKAKSLDTAIRNQLRTRVQLLAESAAQSRVLLDAAGAEELKVPGRALMRLPGGRGLIQVQTPFISGDALDTEAPPGTIVVDDPKLTDEERVRLLFASGMSRRQIERRVRGYSGGAATAFVARVLAS